jgi:hypothetical protein
MTNGIKVLLQMQSGFLQLESTLPTAYLSIVFLPLIEILTKFINHTDKETVYNPLTGNKPVIFARWVPPN